MDSPISTKQRIAWGRVIFSPRLVRDNENVASQLKASQAELARNNNIINQIKAAQIQVVGERRAPGVQHGRDTDPGAEALGIGSDGERRLGRRLHQQVVDYTLVLVGDVTQLARQRNFSRKRTNR